nr:MAG: esterase [Pseudomonadota bacterium]
MRGSLSRWLQGWLAPLVLAGTWMLQATAAEPPAGRLEQIQVHGPSLEGNLSGDSATRTVFVYLPPGYAADGSRRYPVLYFLHGFGAAAQMYVNFLGLPRVLDAAIAEGRVPPLIVVLPDVLNRFGGSMYSNSPTIGDWESFIARDLVAYIDGHYRTLAQRESRGLAGHSMGGYGTLRIGMKQPDVFVALYSMSACCLDPRQVAPADATNEQVRTLEDVEKLPVLGRTTLAASASWAPNPQNPPLYLDLPTRSGASQQDVLARFAANAPTVMASQYVPQLKGHAAIRMDIGEQDGLIGGNALMTQVLTKLGVPHEYETYPGDHMNKVAERFAQHVLPFFARHLATSDRPGGGGSR